mmetsp:Transcript_13321/g.18269  ORF Transcript_13321/g.18269 Transcript_13321/m.18269 type:complete len:157 (+) Transcript_13321:73-543(+)
MMTPLGFALVDQEIYRSAYPATKVYPFIETLNLKSMVCLTPSELKSELRSFAETKSIHIAEFDVKHNQEPFLIMSESVVSSALNFVCDKSHWPLLIFCTNGKVKTAVVVACLRKRMGWSISSIVHEYERFCEPDSNLLDLQFIENFEIDCPSNTIS